MKLWKASEHRAWLLYYSLPVLSDLLPPDYIYHLSLLVSAMHILLGDSIPIGDVDMADQQLQLFFKLVPQLYYPKICGTNIHNLIHISQFVLNWGPLWSYSLFGYESMNGHLRKNCHGTGYILPQLVHNMKMHQKLPQKGKRIAKSSKSRKTAEFICQLSGVKEKSKELEIKSRITHTQLKPIVVNALCSASFLESAPLSPSFPTCNRIRYKSTLYAIAKEGNCRDGSICVFEDQDHLHFGSIIQFCFVRKVVREFDEMNRTIVDNIQSARQA